MYLHDHTQLKLCASASVVFADPVQNYDDRQRREDLPYRKLARDNAAPSNTCDPSQWESNSYGRLDIMRLNCLNPWRSPWGISFAEYHHWKLDGRGPDIATNTVPATTVRGMT